MKSFILPIPTYQCHKRVQALRIKALVPNPRGYELHFEDELFVPVQVREGWVINNAAASGDYAIWDSDGVFFCLPAAAFEAGYTLVDGAGARKCDTPNMCEEFGCACETALASREAEIERLRADIGAKQAEIDRLMLEFCPEEMTPEQRAEWARHQKPVGPATQAAREVGK